jgi:surface antigen
MSRIPLSCLSALAVAAAMLLPGLLPAPAQAQMMQSYLPRRLTTSDMTILRKEAAKLGPNGPAEEGWSNPKTGHSGVVTFIRNYEQSGMKCRSFKYVFHTGTRTDGLPYQLDWCQKPNGQWAIANGHKG